jgi:hypothetical protein
MIQKKVNEITLSDVQELITLGVEESKTIEYKKELKIGTDSEKKEFLADISSFANTNGGDLIFGIEAPGGIPIGLSPIAIPDLDTQKLQLESIIRTGINPRISFTIQTIESGTPNEYILLIRISESWNKPHRVTHSGSNRFCARNSGGKYDLDVDELRQVFTLSDGIEKRIEDFKIERILALETEKTFLSLNSKNLIVLHLLPLESFSTRVNLDRDLLLSLEAETDLFRPMNTNSWNRAKINLEGTSSSTNFVDGSVRSYIQLFRNSAVELVESSILEREGHNFIPYVLYEKEIVYGFKKGVEILKKVGINTPVLLSLSLLNVDGLVMAESRTSGRIRIEDPHPIKQKNLILPTVMLNEYSESIETLLQPVFDLVWNACGLPRSENYDNEGNFLINN